MNFQCTRCSHWSLSRTEFFQHKKSCGRKRQRIDSASTSYEEHVENVVLHEINDAQAQGDIGQHQLDDVASHWAKNAHLLMVQFLLTLKERNICDTDIQIIFKEIENLLSFIFSKIMEEGEIHVALELVFHQLMTKYYRDETLKV